MSASRPNYNIQIGQSETYRKVWIYGDAKKRPVNIEGYKFWMDITDKAGKVVIRMTSDNQSGDRISLSLANEGKWVEIFDPCNLKPGALYYYDLLMEDTQGKRRIIREGEVLVEPTRTKVTDD